MGEDNDLRCIATCSVLHPQQIIKYDCSGTGAFCNGPAPTPAPPTPPQPVPSSCSGSCNSGGRSFSCQDRIQWAKDNVTKNGVPIGLCAAINMVNGECSGQCSCQDSDF